MLNLFTIVNFTNTQCYTPEGRIGTCYHPLECSEIGGQPLGSCAQGFGVCCYGEFNNIFVSLWDLEIKFTIIGKLPNV